jgi:DNA-binding LacI/PurR family transcriptional regulator
VRRKRITSVDVANEAGVSQATVARVFNSPELVSPDTRMRVLLAADHLGYVPNAIARSLKSRRTNMIGAVVPAEGEYWQHVLTSFSRQLGTHDQQLLLFSFFEQADVDQVLETVAQYQVDGVLLASSQIGQAQLSRMRSVSLPVVAFNQPAAAGVVPSVSVDNEAGSASIANHLVAQGCTTALFVGGFSGASTDQVRYRGAARAFGQSGVALPYIESGSFSYEDGFKIAAQILELGELPDVLMVAGDELAFGVLDFLRSAGVSVPDDVMVTGFDGLPQASWRAYDMTTLVQATDVLVERAIENLLNPAEPSAQPADIVVPGMLRVGATTRRSAK